VLFAALLGYAPAAPPQVAPAAASHLLSPNFRYRTTLHGTGPALWWRTRVRGTQCMCMATGQTTTFCGGTQPPPVHSASMTMPWILLLTSQNWYAEQLLNTLGKERRGEGSWEAGLAVEREFLTRVVGIDSRAFVLRDASRLSAYNLITPHALVQIDVVKTIATGDLQ